MWQGLKAPRVLRPGCPIQRPLLIHSDAVVGLQEGQGTSREMPLNSRISRIHCCATYLLTHKQMSNCYPGFA